MSNSNAKDSVVDDWLSADTITIDVGDFNFSSMNTSSITGAQGSSGQFTYANNFYSSPYTINTAVGTTTGNQLHVQGSADFDGDVRIKGRSLEKMLKKIEDRLAIIEEPSAEKLEKFKALKKAYENYRMIERLIGEDSNDSAEK